MKRRSIDHEALKAPALERVFGSRSVTMRIFLGLPSNWGRVQSIVVIGWLCRTTCGGRAASTSPTGPTSTGPNACGETFSDPECHTIVVGGTTRAYLLHVPATFQPNVGALVIGLHGSDGSGL